VENRGRRAISSQNSKLRRQYCGTRDIWSRHASFAMREFSDMTDLYLRCASVASPGPRPRGRRHAWTVKWLSVMLAVAAGSANAAPLDQAAERYRPYVIENIGQALAGVRDLRARLAAKDLAAARKAWIAARAGWERSEVFTAGFVPELDAQIDAWPNAEAGFHAIEAKLFGADSIDVERETNALVDHLSDLDGKLRDIALTPQGLLDGTVRLAYEVGESKSDGGESRVSGTSLDDMRSNVSGLQFAYRTIFADELKSCDRKLADVVDAKIEELGMLLVVRDLKAVNVPKLRRTSEELVIALQSASAKLGLRRPALEAAAR
jgi:iron uptake system EfeUOB component EfeO/EfeM